jgi:riboflavin kinase/FMN adenylyltransferase
MIALSEFRVFRSVEEARGVFGPSAVAIGNFDGVHRGHQLVFARCVEAARRHGCKPSAILFDPHPAKVLNPQRAPRLLSTIEQRCRWIRECGIRQVLIIPFTIEFSHLEPEDFVRQVLVDCANACAVFVGENFHFGRNRAGNAALLAELGPRFGFSAELVPSATFRGRVISSSEIRRLIESGNVTMASRFLGRPYGLEGDVVPGHGIGSKETVPTLNLATEAEVLPAGGVYVTETVDLDSAKSWNSVTNVGFRPTFGGDDTLSIETFLLEKPQHRPSRIRVDFLKRLREERRFPDATALRAQILRDAARAQAWHRRTRRALESRGAGACTSGSPPGMH